MNDYTHWEYDPETRTVFAPDIEDGITLATVEPYDDVDDIGRLIAAAPEMYAIVEWVASLAENQRATNAMIQEARELIKRVDDLSSEEAHHEGTE